jgi:ABC-type multidrug transport system ATPase subunit
MVVGVLKVSGSVVRGAPPRTLVGSNLATPPPDPHCTGHKWLADSAVTAGVHPSSAGGWAMRRLDEFGLTGQADLLLGRYQPTERRLLRVAAASAGTPPVVVLDEPTAGLPEAQRSMVRRFIGRLRAHNHAVVVAIDSADLATVDCDRYYVLADGAVVARGTMSELHAAQAV